MSPKLSPDEHRAAIQLAGTLDNDAEYGDAFAALRRQFGDMRAIEIDNVAEALDVELYADIRTCGGEL